MPIICDEREDLAKRELALLLLDQSAPDVLDNRLVALTLNTETPMEIRAHCAMLVGKRGSDSQKQALAPLARGEAGDDPVDVLKGLGLRALLGQLPQGCRSIPTFDSAKEFESKRSLRRILTL